MSALPPKADMDEHGRDADQVRCSKKIGSLEVGAVAKNANRDAGLFAVFEGVGDAGRVWRLRTDWYAKWKIMDWSGPAAAALPQNRRMSSMVTPRQSNTASSR